MNKLNNVECVSKSGIVRTVRRNGTLITCQTDWQVINDFDQRNDQEFIFKNNINNTSSHYKFKLPHQYKFNLIKFIKAKLENNKVFI